MPSHLLPQTFLDLNDIGTEHKTVVTLYGRRADGTLISLACDNGGILSSNVAVTVNPGGSLNSYFKDHVGLALNGTFQPLTFGFTSYSISLFNDDTGTEAIEFSFDGANVHGRLKNAEKFTQDARAQSGIYLRTVSGGAAPYRLIVY